MKRIDVYPTHTFTNYELRIGRPYPFGANFVPGGINFSVFSRHADFCELVLFEKGEQEPLIKIPFRGLFTDSETGEIVWTDFRVGNVFCMIVFNLDYENIEYGYCMDGPYQRTKKGAPGIHRFDPTIILSDPYARGIGGREIWGEKPNHGNKYQYRAHLVSDDFDWESDRPLEIPIEDLCIYEMHVRGFTAHPSSDVKYPGTFAAIFEKIPYLKTLGINCVELMPVYEFDEFENTFVNPETGEKLMNYWGYDPICFFAPKSGYAAVGKSRDSTLVADEFKSLIKELHENGIEIILDVVFNHTAEGNEHGPIISFRGIDNATYYMLTPEGCYFNFSGTGNTLNCNNPIVRSLILDCLRFWVAEYHIDGFRFDLATILGRSPQGKPMSNPPLLEELAFDPILAKCKLIAEAWDAGGLFQVGTFPAYGRWIEWNSQYRDTLRKYLNSEYGQIANMSQIIQGSPHLYGKRGIKSSVNFVTCHDGFTLLDLFSYSERHNLANGENNLDGGNKNFSNNYGHEGATEDPYINAIRVRQIKNAISILMISQGIPMVLMGDEMGRTQKGNNNPYCQDNEISWLDWTLLEQNKEIFNFMKQFIHFRKNYPILRYGIHTSKQAIANNHYKPITWHNRRPWHVDWSPNNRAFAVMFHDYCSTEKQKSISMQYFIYVGMNMDESDHYFELPTLPLLYQWHLFANTYETFPNDVYQPNNEHLLEEQKQFLVPNRTVVTLIGKTRVSV